MPFASSSFRISPGVPLPRAPRLRRRLRRRAQVEQRRGTAIEDPQRLEEQAAERDQRHAAVLLVGDARGGARAALHEAEVDLALGIAQRAQVVERAARRLQHHLDAVGGELGGVTLAEFGVGALLRAGGQHHAPGGAGSST